MAKERTDSRKTESTASRKRTASRPAKHSISATSTFDAEAYRDMIDSVPDYEIILLDVLGRILTWNTGAEKLKGYRAEEVVGKPLSIFFTAEDIQAGKPQQELQAALTSGRFETEGWRVRKDGSRFWANVVFTVVRDPSGTHKGFVKVARDETERQKLESNRTKSIETLRGAINRIASASTQISASTTEQAAGAREQAAAVTQVMTTVDEVQQVADQTTQRAKISVDTAQKNIANSDAGKRAIDDSIAAQQRVNELVEATAENILSLAEQAQSIGEIIALVNDIAEQSNLLALNAAIEASRAGEYGRGFSVVAAEVKALADQSKKATGQVRQILGEIQKATNTAVLSIEDVTKNVAASIKLGTQAGDSITSLAKLLEAAAQTSAQITASASQQTTGMNQIHQAMKNVELSSRQGLTALEQTSKAMQDLNQLSSQLSAIVLE